MPDTSREERRKKILEALNKARSMELHAIHQYMNQHYNLDDRDYGELAANVKLIAIDEMRHAEMFAERIKELGGEPTTEMADKVTRGQEVEAMFPMDAGLEDTTMDEYNRFARICHDNGDSETMKLFETIIGEEQTHFNYFDNVGEHIKKLGASYLARIAGTPADTGPPSKGFVTGGGNA
ncbi:MAG TPA: bacterioferritin [Spirochaetota bacterium]|nr:bacterioferritin [Spirochaetota bacterium]HOD16681.1 bacterioferritin [Spirochaetota bacterium]HPG50434.1 bacterioferritin [Spirochaetota bacterium]HPN13349.1 bacterioferritin [Spirochaetota bacterium]HQL82386.1 bacterioferritin [Spirochaetota bacterium]